MGEHRFSSGNIDLHVHTVFSDGTSSVEDVARAAEKKNLSLVAVTDHYSEFSELPKRMMKRNLQEYLDALEGFKLLKGAEVEIFDDGTVSISRTTVPMFDVIIGGLHANGGVNFWRDLSPILDPLRFMENLRVALIKAFESKTFDIIAHVTRLPDSLQSDYPSIFTDSWIESVVRAASDNNVAVELSGAWKLPDERFVSECLKQGVKLSLGSDAHTPQMIGETGYGLELLKRLNVDNDLIFLPRKLRTVHDW